MSLEAIVSGITILVILLGGIIYGVVKMKKSDTL